MLMAKFGLKFGKSIKNKGASYIWGGQGLFIEKFLRN